MTAPHPPGLRLIGRRFNPRWFLCFVADTSTGSDVRVRVDLKRRTKRYWCDACGPQDAPLCLHTLTAHQLTHEGTR